MSRNVAIVCLILVICGYYYIQPVENSFRFRPGHSNPDRVLKSTTRHVPPVKMLSSRLDFWGLSSGIEYPDYRGNNPSMLSLPHHLPDGNATLVVVANVPLGPPELIDGNEINMRTVFASILDVAEQRSPVPRTEPRNYPLIQSHSLNRLDDLVFSDHNSFPECDMYPIFRNIQGPEDGRLFWSSLGEPLMIHNSPSPKNSNLCRVLYLVDLRVVYPILRDIISAPIRFDRSVALLIPGQDGIHKNWAPFTDSVGDVFVHVNLIPQTIYKLNTPIADLPTYSSPASDLLPTLEPVVFQTLEEPNCIRSILNDVDWEAIHQASPFIEVILCTSAEVRSRECDPNDPANRLYVGVLHVQDKSRWPTFYEPRIMTLNSSAPFNYVSVSRPLFYSSSPIEISVDMVVGTSQWQQIYTVSLTVHKSPVSAISDRGSTVAFLDDWLFVSYGVADDSSYFALVTVKEIMTDHEMCEEFQA